LIATQKRLERAVSAPLQSLQQYLVSHHARTGSRDILGTPVDNRWIQQRLGTLLTGAPLCQRSLALGKGNLKKGIRKVPAGEPGL